MTTIEIQNLRLHGFHGIYEGEPKVGNEYQINLEVSFQEREHDFDSIGGTVNYEELFRIVKQQMELNTPLLEKLCEEIIGKIKEQYSFVTQVRLSIYKLQAAIPNLEGRVGVTLYKSFND